MMIALQIIGVLVLFVVNSIGLWFAWAFEGARAGLPVALGLAALAAVFWVLRRVL